MVIDNYDDEYNEYDDEEESSSGGNNPQWRTLSPKERKLLMKNVFSNPEWYDDSQDRLSLKEEPRTQCLKKYRRKQVRPLEK